MGWVWAVPSVLSSSPTALTTAYILKKRSRSTAARSVVGLCGVSAAYGDPCCTRDVEGAEAHRRGLLRLITVDMDTYGAEMKSWPRPLRLEQAALANRWGAATPAASNASPTIGSRSATPGDIGPAPLRQALRRRSGKGRLSGRDVQEAYMSFIKTRCWTRSRYGLPRLQLLCGLPPPLVG